MAIRLKTQRNRRSNGRHDKRQHNNEPADYAQIQPAQDIQQVDRGAAKHNLGGCCPEMQHTQIQTHIHSQEQQIQEGGRTQLLNETHFPVLHFHQEKMASNVEQVMNLACCSKEDAERALLETNQSVIDAVDKLLDAPKVRGDKYIPPRPTIDDGLTDEVRNKLKQARELFDLLNAAPRASGTEKRQEVVPRDEESVETNVPALSFEPPRAESPVESS